MRTGKPGIWWVLRQKGSPIFFTGGMVEHRRGDVMLQLAEYTLDRENAQQFMDKSSAESIAAVFGLGGAVEAVELEFAA